MTYMELFLRHGADIARFTERYGGDIDVLMLKACHDADVDRVGKLIICGASLKHTLVDITWRTQHHAHSAESRAAFLEAQTAIIRLLCEHGTVPADGIADRN